MNSDTRIIAAIDDAAVESPSGAMVAFRNGLQFRREFDPLREILGGYSALMDSGWAVKYPPGYEGGVHQDSSDLLVYYPANHPSRLLIGDVPFSTTAGTHLLIPKGLPHGIEPVKNHPRYAVVWMLR
jgi:hypothetical protein